MTKASKSNVIGEIKGYYFKLFSHNKRMKSTRIRSPDIRVVQTHQSLAFKIYIYIKPGYFFCLVHFLTTDAKVASCFWLSGWKLQIFHIIICNYLWFKVIWKSNLKTEIRKSLITMHTTSSYPSPICTTISWGLVSISMNWQLNKRNRAGLKLFMAI